MPGFVPQVTCGASFSTSTTTSRSKDAASSVRELPPVVERLLPARPFGAAGRPSR